MIDNKSTSSEVIQEWEKERNPVDAPTPNQYRAAVQDQVKEREGTVVSPDAAPREAFRNSVGFQIMFILHSGLDIETAVDHICSAADRLFANSHDAAINAAKEIVKTAIDDSHDALIAERDKLLQALETRAEREMQMLEGVARENDALRAAIQFALSTPGLIKGRDQLVAALALGTSEAKGNQ